MCRHHRHEGRDAHREIGAHSGDAVVDHQPSPRLTRGGQTFISHTMLTHDAEAPGTCPPPPWLKCECFAIASDLVNDNVPPHPETASGGAALGAARWRQSRGQRAIGCCSPGLPDKPSRNLYRLRTKSLNGTVVNPHQTPNGTIVKSPEPANGTVVKPPESANGTVVKPPEPAIGTDLYHPLSPPIVRHSF
jgi:hypothetical protein